MHHRLICRLLAVLAGSVGLVQGEPAPVKTFELIAARFAFTPDRIEVQQGDHVIVRLHSADVEHGFALKELGVATIVPAGGETVSVEFVASRAGTFEFACSSYCGKGHHEMTGMLVVTPAGGGAAPLMVTTRRTNPAEPDYTVLTLPTTAHLPAGKMAFRVTHRFSRPLGQGSFGDLAGDLFALDSSATVGLEVRAGLTGHLQAGLYRTSDRTIELFAQDRLAAEGETFPVSVALHVSVEGQDNFGLSSASNGVDTEYSPQVSLVVSRRLGQRGAVYVQPSWVGNANLHLDREGIDDAMLLLNLGLRLGIGHGAYVVAAAAPRVAGYKPLRADGSTSAPALSFGLEHRVGGHMFQLNVSNTIGTTPAQFARAQDSAVTRDWYLGFGISRRFF
jgi:plastocyanin